MMIRDEDTVMVKKALELSLKRGKINREQYDALLLRLKRIEQEIKAQELSKINSGISKFLNDMQSNINIRSSERVELNDQHQLV